MTPVVSIEHVTLIREGHTILDDVSWSIGPSENWVLFGPNGSGKTTMLQVASTYQLPTRGTVAVLGEKVGRVDVRTLRPRIGYVGAEPTALLHQSLRSLEVVVTGRRASFVHPRFHHYEPGEWDLARRCLTQVDALDLADRTFRTLSEGEKKRVMIARSLVTRPELLLLDEPASALDLGARERLLGSLSALAEAGHPPIVMVTHHLEEIPSGFDHIVMMSGGRVVASGPIATVLDESSLSAAFGLPLGVERRGDRWRAWARDEAASDPMS